MTRDKEQAISNLKKLKAFHNGSYGMDIDMAIKVLEREPCEDAISRQAAIDGLNSINGTSELDKAFEVIENLPPVTPQPKTGHWIFVQHNWHCSECGESPKTMGYVGSAEFMAEHFKYCNHCGSKMIEPQESEE